MVRKVHFLIVAGASFIGFAVSAGGAGEWPDRPVRIIAPFAASGTSDVLGRLIANDFTEAFHQPFFIENRAGGLGMIGTETVANAKPDGYKLLVSSLAPNIIGHHIMETRTMRMTKANHIPT